MKKVLGILVLGLLLITPSWADDIRDFQIAGMSVGDSALDYFSEDKIKNNIGRPYPNSNKFNMIEILISSENYDSVQFHVKSNDKKYIIYVLAGFKFFEHRIEDCYKLKDKISKEAEKLFVNIEKKSYKQKHAGDKTGKSINEGYNFYFKSGDYINIACYDWSKKMEDEMNFLDHLRVGLLTYEFRKWLNEEAF